MTFRQKTMAKLGKEPATPGYTGYIPAMRNHLIGHSYGDSTRRAAACTDSLRHREYPKAIELTVETRPNDRNFFYAQTSRAALEQPPKAIKWIASKRDLPPDSWATSGLLDLRRMKTCIGTTPTGVTFTPAHMSIPDGPYKDRAICTRRTFERLKDDVLEVAEGRHHVKGYSGHTHASQHMYGKSYGKVTRTLRPLPADPRTSREYQNYADSRALVVNEFELKQAGYGPNMRYHHFTLLAPGHKPGGPGPYVEDPTKMNNTSNTPEFNRQYGISALERYEPDRCRCCRDCSYPGTSREHLHPLSPANPTACKPPYTAPPPNQGGPSGVPGNTQGHGAPPPTSVSEIRKDIEWKWPDPVGFQAKTPPCKFLKPHW